MCSDAPDNRIAPSAAKLANRSLFTMEDDESAIHICDLPLRRRTQPSGKRTPQMCDYRVGSVICEGT